MKRKVKLGEKSDHFIQAADVKKWALHKMLHICECETLPVPLLRKIQKLKIGARVEHNGYVIPITTLLKRRVNFALLMSKLRKD
jgi:hypothetical protein